jgi:hypothetical protein
MQIFGEILVTSLVSSHLQNMPTPSPRPQMDRSNKYKKKPVGGGEFTIRVERKP